MWKSLTSNIIRASNRSIGYTSSATHPIFIRSFSRTNSVTNHDSRFKDLTKSIVEAGGFAEAERLEGPDNFGVDVRRSRAQPLKTLIRVAESLPKGYPNLLKYAFASNFITRSKYSSPGADAGVQGADILMNVTAVQLQDYEFVHPVGFTFGTAPLDEETKAIFNTSFLPMCHVQVDHSTAESFFKEEKVDILKEIEKFEVTPNTSLVKTFPPGAFVGAEYEKLSSDSQNFFYKEENLVSHVLVEFPKDVNNAVSEIFKHDILGIWLHSNGLKLAKSIQYEEVTYNHALHAKIPLYYFGKEESKDLSISRLQEFFSAVKRGEITGLTGDISSENEFLLTNA